MIRLTIENFRAVEQIEMQLDGLIALEGMNLQGKSSTALALAAALLGERKPAGYSSNNPDAVIRRGTEAAKVSLQCDDVGNTTIIWTKGRTGDLGMAGEPPRASEIAVGWRTLEPYRGKEWADFVAGLAGNPEPPTEQAETIMREAGLGDAEVNACLAMLQTAGWDAVAERFAKEATRWQAQWETAAGTRYGAQKAEGWLPEGMDPALAETPLSELEQAVTQAEMELRRLTLEAETEKAAEKIKDEYAERDRQRAEREDIAMRLAELRNRKLQLEIEAKGMPCPVCETPLVIRLMEGGIRRLFKHQSHQETDAKRAVELRIIDADVDRLQKQLNQEALL